jgi:hypothetical protein
LLLEGNGYAEKWKAEWLYQNNQKMAEWREVGAIQAMPSFFILAGGYLLATLYTLMEKDQ